jgi:hypothetical protein
MESIEDLQGLSDDEQAKLEAMVKSKVGQETLAKRMGRNPGEITFEEARNLYAQNPDPLFFANEIKLDDPLVPEAPASLPLQTEESKKGNRQKAA